MVDMAVGQLGTMDGFGLGAAPLPVAARQRIDAGIQMAGSLDLLACAALVAAGISEVLRKRVSIAAALWSPGLRLR